MTECPKLAAIAIVVRDDLVLLVKRRNEPDAGLWGFPGGHVDLGEAAFEAAVRELHEETGIVARPDRYLTNVDVITYGTDGSVRFHFLLAAVLCDYVSGEPIAQDDVSETRWWPIEDVMGGKADCSKHVDSVVKLAIDL